MRIWILKTLMILFAVLSLLCLGLGIYLKDILFIAMGLLLGLTCLLVLLEQRQVYLNPFGKH